MVTDEPGAHAGVRTRIAEFELRSPGASRENAWLYASGIRLWNWLHVQGLRLRLVWSLPATLKIFHARIAATKLFFKEGIESLRRRTIKADLPSPYSPIVGILIEAFIAASQHIADWRTAGNDHIAEAALDRNFQGNLVGLIKQALGRLVARYVVTLPHPVQPLRTSIQT